MWFAFLLVATAADESSVRQLLRGTRAQVHLPAGKISVSSEIRIPDGFHVKGHAKGTVLKASDSFSGRAILVCGRNVVVEDLTLDGNRARLARTEELAPYDRDFIGYYERNGLVADRIENLTVRGVVFRNIANFAAIVARSRYVLFERVRVEDSGSLNANGRNNTTGGILLEEGTEGFTVRASVFLRVRGNGVWTHSRYESPRNRAGVIESNHFEEIGRDAIQAGHATQLRIERNTGRRIGWPVEVVDAEGGGTPVAIDTAGNVDKSVYAGNRFEEINGKCIDLDGFHTGTVRENVCINRGRAEDYQYGHFGIVFNNTNPDMQSTQIQVIDNVIDGTKYGGIFVIGHENRIARNKLSRINLARCNETPGCIWDPKQPDLLRAGIYIGSKAERPAPARANIVTDNLVTGHGMKQHCIAGAPGVSLDRQIIARNKCRNLP